MARASRDEIERAAFRTGMRGLWDDGVEKATAGLTSLDGARPRRLQLASRPHEPGRDQTGPTAQPRYWRASVVSCTNRNASCGLLKV